MLKTTFELPGVGIEIRLGLEMAEACIVVIMMVADVAVWLLALIYLQQYSCYTSSHNG